MLLNKMVIYIGTSISIALTGIIGLIAVMIIIGASIQPIAPEMSVSLVNNGMFLAFIVVVIPLLFKFLH
jgi:hypothetical protein